MIRAFNLKKFLSSVAYPVGGGVLSAILTGGAMKSYADMLRKMGRIRMYGTALTREWMNLLGARTHYVSSDGTRELEI